MFLWYNSSFFCTSFDQTVGCIVRCVSFFPSFTFAFDANHHQLVATTSLTFNIALKNCFTLGLCRLFFVILNLLKLFAFIIVNKSITCSKLRIILYVKMMQRIQCIQRFTGVFNGNVNARWLKLIHLCDRFFSIS